MISLKEFFIFEAFDRAKWLRVAKKIIDLYHRDDEDGLHDFFASPEFKSFIPPDQGDSLENPDDQMLWDIASGEIDFGFDHLKNIRVFDDLIKRYEELKK